MGGGPTEGQHPGMPNLLSMDVPYSTGPNDWESIFTTDDHPMEISPSAECESSLVLELDEELSGRIGKAEFVSPRTTESRKAGGNDVQVFKSHDDEQEKTVDSLGNARKGSSSLNKGTCYERGMLNSPSDGIIVHKLMLVTSDKLDLSFVEKVIIPPHEIGMLCNQISPSSAAFRDGKCFLNFQLLNRTPLQVVGLYGSKPVLVDVFKRLNFSSVVTLLKAGKLDAGIYGFHIADVIYVFYWHQGKRMEEASRKNVSCNFIRYVVDLCGTVYVCLDSKDMEASLQTTPDSMAASRKQRTQSLQISVVKESENDLRLSKGFHIYPSKVLGKGWLPVGDVQDLVPGDLRPRFASSLLRSAVLTATRCPPRIVQRKQYKKVSIRELPELAREWSSTSNLDVLKLPESELVQFVEYGELEGHKSYSSLMDSFASRRADHEHAFWKVDELLKQEEEKVVTVLKRAREVYLELSHPWEESLIRYALPAMAKDEGLVSAEQTNSVNASADRLSEMVSAQVELSRLWTGGRHGFSLLFVGSEVQIVSESGEKYKRKWTEDYVIGSSSKAAGPVLLGQEFVLRPKGTASQSSHTCIAHAVGADCPNGPLLTSRFVRLELKTPGTGVKLSQHDTVKLEILSLTSTGQGMYDWMDFYGKCIPNLDKFMVDVAMAMSSPSKIGASVSSSVRDLAKSDDAMKTFRKNFSEYEGPSLRRAPDDQPGYSAESRAASLARLETSQREELVQACKAVYRQACLELATTMTSMVNREITPMIKQMLEIERSRQSTSMEESLQRDRSACLTDIRLRLSSGKVPGRRTLAVTGCSRESGTWHLKDCFPGAWKRNTKDNGSDSVELRFVTEETESERISWMIAELTPMKKDLDALLLKEAHLIVPECSTNYRLLDVDPRFQRLSYVFPVKSGEVLVFVDDDREWAIHLYVIPKLGREIQASNPMKTLRRGRDLVAVDEVVKLAAFYDRKMGKVSILRFDETFRHFEWSGVDIFLSEFAGSRILTSMLFIPGKREIIFVDSDRKVRVCEINQPAMMKPRHVLLQGPEHKICITPDGSCLLVIHGSGIPATNARDNVLNVSEEVVVDDTLDSDPENVLMLDAYLLDGTMSKLKSLKLSGSFSDVRGIEVTTVAFGIQSHLILVDAFQAAKGIASELLEVTSASEVCQLQTLSKSTTIHTGSASRSQASQKNVTCPSLEYVHHILDKYATSPPLISGERELCVHIVLGGGAQAKMLKFKGNCTRYLESCVEKLQRDKGKDFSSLKLTFASGVLDSYVVNQTLVESAEIRNRVSTGDWVRLLVSLVPIQIARAENNGLRPLIDGLQISSNLNYADAVGLAEALRFGFYDAILGQWTGPIKVISSMGKQSSGKSYLLNHLSGSLLDVAGGRCTDGVWMTMRASRGCLYVLLDFEGLGSFERSEQEDMLLSILNAAVSNITIFNKKDFHLDKETEAVFERFQNGVTMVKQDSRLFKGLFYMAIKDVDTADVEDLKAEFYTKIQQICSKSQDNFLTRMYGGEVEVAAMPPFQRHEYHDSVADIAATVEEIKAIHQSGRSLLVDLKLVIAQISARDWSPIDTKRIALRLELLKQHFKSAIKFGRLKTNSENVLINFETQEPVPDFPAVVDGHVFSLSDTGLELSPRQDTQLMGDILESLRNHFQAVHPRTGVDDEVWHCTYEKFLMAMADRRKERILEWLSCNTGDFQDDGDVQKLRLETVVVLAELKQRLSLCSSKCKFCFLRCVLEKSHPDGKSFHSCLGSHRCSETCTFCRSENPEQTVLHSVCSDLSGHEGPHDCKIKSHTCGQDCSLKETSSNCNISCAWKPGHSGDHKCNTKQHMCAEECSLPVCKNSCIIPLDTGEHVHMCHERMCPVNCTMDGCNRKCGSEDHFHVRSSETHLCGSEHTCTMTCESQGICEIVTEVAKKLKMFSGKRSVFEYEHVSEQNAVRKACCIAIPPGKETHDGDHCHTVNPNAVHFCETKCPACGYFCNLPIGHPGVHDTTHGNMRDVHFVAESEDIDLVDRKYAWGESGRAEMCMMHCKAQGRGHVHLMKCPAHAQTRGPCAEGMYEGARHQTQEYGPDKHVAKDELTHAAYWKRLRFKDPCQEDDQKQFELCNHFCRSDEHVPATSVKNSAQSRSYCVDKLWHMPVSKTGLSAASTGYVTEDGHSFACDHLKNAANHVVFVIDRSGSMGESDVKPTLAKFSGGHNNRLGCVFEAIVRFIRTRMAAGQADVVSVILFDKTGSIAIERQPISEQLVDGLLHYYTGGGTTYSSGLTLTQQVLQRGLYDSSMQAKHPAVVFLSDGGNNGGTNPLSLINEMKDLDHRLVFHTILFGKDYVDQKILRKMAAAGDGRYEVSIDEVQLAKSFEGLAKSLRPKVVSLM